MGLWSKQSNFFGIDGILFETVNILANNDFSSNFLPSLVKVVRILSRDYVPSKSWYLEVLLLSFSKSSFCACISYLVRLPSQQIKGELLMSPIDILSVILFLVFYLFPNFTQECGAVLRELQLLP